MVVLLPVFVMAQKPLKPNVNKALTSWRKGELAEAKEMIDVCVTAEKLMNDGKTWYYKGLIYAALDTTKNEAYKALAENPLEEAVKAFQKADALADKGKDYFITDPNVVMPITMSQQIEGLYNYYINEGANAYRDDDFQGAVKQFTKGSVIKPGDTTAYYYSGIVYFQGLEEYDQAIASLNKYVELGGTSPDVYSILYNIYIQQKDDKEKALSLVREARTRFPENSEFAKLEIGLLIDLGKTADAKSGLESAIQKEPDNKVLHFYLGYVNDKLGNIEQARKSYEAASKIDSEYFEAKYYNALTYYAEIDKLSKEINNLGNSAADNKRRTPLYQERVKKCESTIPIWEALEKSKLPDLDSQLDVLGKLSQMYYYIADDKNYERVNKKMQALEGN